MKRITILLLALALIPACSRSSDDPTTGLPTAIISVDAFSGEAPLLVNFDGSGSLLAVSYTWDFGDGTPTATGAAATHTYLPAGIHTASLTVTNAQGADHTASVLIDVQPET